MLPLSMLASSDAGRARARACPLLSMHHVVRVLLLCVATQHVAWASAAARDVAVASASAVRADAAKALALCCLRCSSGRSSSCWTSRDKQQSSSCDTRRPQGGACWCCACRVGGQGPYWGWQQDPNNCELKGLVVGVGRLEALHAAVLLPLHGASLSQMQTRREGSSMRAMRASSSGGRAASNATSGVSRAAFLEHFPDYLGTPLKTQAPPSQTIASTIPRVN